MSGKWTSTVAKHPTSVETMAVEARELLGDAIHTAVHPGHEWAACANPDAVYELWMPRFLERVVFSPFAPALAEHLRAFRDDLP